MHGGEGAAVTETDRAAAFAWAAGQLTWERRLRELEAAASPAEESVAEPARQPAGASIHRTGRHILRNV